jgi:drug/metabolite transporter (DMT)-like permease
MDAAAQLLFKNAAVHLPEPSATLGWVYLVATSGLVWVALACLGAVFIIWMMILRRSALGTAFPMTALTYVVVVAMSRLLFDETVAPLQYTGIAVIMVGVTLLRPVR